MPPFFLYEISNLCLNSNLNGFSFDTVNYEDGYYKGGTFHPFGNPYLRYDEGTGYIQALNENGQWINVYYAGSLPIQSFLLYYSGNTYEEITGGYVGYPYKPSTSGTGSLTSASVSNSTSGLKMTGHSAYGGSIITNKLIDLSGFKKLTVTVTSINANPTLYIIDTIKNGYTGISQVLVKGENVIDISNIDSGYLAFYLWDTASITVTKIELS